MKEKLYRIPPLKWVQVRDGERPKWGANAARYSVTIVLGSDGLARLFQNIPYDPIKPPDFATVEQAKTYACVVYCELMSWGLEEVLPVPASITSVVDERNKGASNDV